MKFKEFYKKRKILVWIVAILLFLIPSWIISYQELKMNGQYAIGITTETYYPKNYRKLTEYYFYFDGKKIEGGYSELAWDTKQIKVPKGKYLVVFSTKDPEKNILLIHKPVIDTINLDSLNKIGVDTEDIDWKKM